MKRPTSAAADLAALLRNSPDVGIADISGLNVTPAVDSGHGPTPDYYAAFLADAVGAPLEHDEQVALFDWADAMQGEHPELCMMFAIPNGGARSPVVGAQLKAEGVRAGVPDIFLAVARGGNGGKVYHGMFLELKRASRTNHATPAQKEWIERLRYHGYAAVICYGAQDAISTIMAYLTQEGA